MTIINTTVQESASYENFLATEEKLNNQASSTVEPFVGDFIDSAKKKDKVNPFSEYYRVVYVNFNNLEDIKAFCETINQFVPGNKKEIFYPEHEHNAVLSDTTKINITDLQLLAPTYGRNRTDEPVSSTLESFFDEEVDDLPALNSKHGFNSASAHWKGMPAFEQNCKYAYRQILVKLRTKADYDEFEVLMGQEILKRDEAAWIPSIYYPKRERKQWINYRWLAEPECNPRHPVYIISKNRQDSMYTSRALSRMGVEHYIIVEPQNMEDYDKALDRFNIRPFVTLVEAPFSNHGDGPGRARNYAWDHSISIGAESHWVLDDNIYDFYRLHQNKKIRMSTGACFKVMEDFVDRYDNVYISGPNYVFFCAETQKYEPYVPNTRIYSTLLIRNDCKHRWRGRYNEDTDLSLRVLKDGDCTVQFNIFLQGKAATQTVKGGNTAEFYHAEGELEKDKWRNSYLNAEGTLNKSKMLVDMHPDVATMVFKYGRWHHIVDYSPFVKNKLRLKSGLVIPNGINEYGLKLIDTYDKDAIIVGSDNLKKKD
jgi:hypothetical protein